MSALSPPASPFVSPFAASLRAAHGITKTMVILAPLIAWSRDIAAIVLAMGAIAVLVQTDLRRAVFSYAAGARAAHVLVGFVLWCGLATLWAPHQPWENWAKAALAIGLGFVFSAGIAARTKAQAQALVPAVMVSAFMLLALLAVERLTHGFFIGQARPSDTTPQLYFAMSGGLALLSCVSTPVAMLMWQRAGTWIGGAAFVTGVLGIGISFPVDAAPTAVLAGVFTALIVLRWGSPALIALAVLLALGLTGWGLLAEGMVKMGLHMWLATHVDPNWGYRLEIWDHVSGLIRTHVLTGHGFDTARVLGADAGLAPAGGTTSFLHPHNGMLQLWLEVGLIGVGLFLATAFLGLKRMAGHTLDRRALAALAGGVTSAAVFWSISFGVWQGWWLSALGIVAVPISLAFAAGRANTATV